MAGLVTGGCGGGDSADGADGDAADRSSTDILVALGDVTAALQDERLATQSALLGDIDAPDAPGFGQANSATAGVSRQIERIEQLIALTTRARSGGQPAAPEEIEAAYAAVTEARPAFADLAADTDVADATDTLDGAPHAAGFGGPSAGDPSAPSDLFVPSLSLGAGQAYRDVVRDHILTGTSRGPQTHVPGDAVITSSPMKTLYSPWRT